MADGPCPATVLVIYRLLLITVEPFLEVSGALQATMLIVTRGVGFVAGDSTFLYTELWGSPWLQLAFVELITLRVLEDLRLWRFPCAGMLLSDLS